MFSARIFILIASIIKIIYDSILSKVADIQRKKTLPAEVADIYDDARYQTYLDYTADSKRLRNKFKIINLIIDCILVFSPIYSIFENLSNNNPYGSFFITYAVVWIVGIVVETWSSYEVTFGIMEKYGLNKKDMREFVKDEVLNQGFSLIIMSALMTLLIFAGEHMYTWTDGFTIGYVKSIILCGLIIAVAYLFLCIARLLGYMVLKKQYVFSPLEEGELRDKIEVLQADSKKKVKKIYVYNESKKTSTKNAFLLKLFWHREFGIADNFINENAENELLAVLSHEIGHLKHKKNIFNFISYGIKVLLVVTVICIVANPEFILFINRWIRESFNITTNNYYLILVVFGYIIQPIGFLINIYESFRSRWEEYEADREAVANGYGKELINTFKTLSNDELINVNPHPFIEFTEYDHPGMYQRIKAINQAMQSL